MNYSDYLELDPMVLFSTMHKQFDVEIPMEITSIEDMNNASRLLLYLSQSWSFVNSLLAYSKRQVRELKREASKSEYEDAIDKKEIIQSIADNLKQQYQAISRAVTIHIENNNELRFTDGGIKK